jgi:hypothetical protein
LKVLLKAVPLTEHHWLVCFKERAVEISTEASHQAIVEADLEKAQSRHTNHASKQRIAAKLNHVGRTSTGGKEVQGSWHDEGSSPAVDSSMSCVGRECGWSWRDTRVDAECTTTAKTSGQKMEEG